MEPHPDYRPHHQPCGAPAGPCVAVVVSAGDFLRSERSLESMEYAVITALLVAAVITALGALALAITSRYSDTTDLIAV